LWKKKILNGIILLELLTRRLCIWNACKQRWGWKPSPDCSGNATGAKRRSHWNKHLNTRLIV